MTLKHKIVWLFSAYAAVVSIQHTIPLLTTSLHEHTFMDDNAIHRHEQKFEVKDTDDYTEQQLRWIQEQRKFALNLTVHEEPMKLHYRAMAGIGHQFVRIAAVYHLATLYKIPRIYLTANQLDGGDIFTIYNYIIGEGPILVDLPFSKFGQGIKMKMGLPIGFPDLTWTKTSSNSDGNGTAEDPILISNQPAKIDVHIKNNVPGYGNPRQHTHTYLKKKYDLNYGKDVTDYHLYKQLMALFYQKHKSRIQQVTNATRFYDHTVFALHVRTGNGEKGDFAKKERGIRHLDMWIDNVVKLLCDYSNNNTHYFSKKPLMIYVGTDTGSVISKLQNASKALCGSSNGNNNVPIPIVSAAQEYPEEGKSVSFSQKQQTQKYLESWESMFLDMYLFTQSNSVIAGSYSSFTQSAPLSVVFAKARVMAQKKEEENTIEEVIQGQHESGNSNDEHPHYFCNVNENGDSMDCFDNFRGWMTSDSVGRFVNWNSTANSTTSGSSSRKKNIHLLSADLHSGVKVEVQFPNEHPNEELLNLFAGSALRLTKS